MKYNELVRDKIPKIIEKKDKIKPKFHIVKNPFVFKQRVKEKLIEEATELLASVEKFYFSEDYQNIAEKFADIAEIMDVVFEAKPKGYLKKVRKKKAKERGRFKKRIILE